MTFSELAHDVAGEFGLSLTDDEVDFLLWEHTGFPHFWIDDPETECRAQLREVLKLKKAPEA